MKNIPKNTTEEEFVKTVQKIAKKIAARYTFASYEAADIEQEAHITAGTPFNLGSPKQIQSILYDKLMLPVIKKTPTGQPSTDESVISLVRSLRAA